MRTVELGTLIDIKHGFAFEGQYFRSDGPFVLLTPGNFYEGGGFKFRREQKHYNGPAPEAFVLKEGDLLVAMTEQGEGLLGSAAFVPHGKPCLHNQRLGLVTAKSGAEVDLKFVYYLLNWSHVRQQIRATSSGAKVRHTSPSRIGAAEIPHISFATQRRIASILSAYDDLIEVNRRRVAVLEEMARGLFDEWFVRFRFPGHETVPILDTQDGPLPEGWDVVTLGQFGHVLTGKTPSKAQPEYFGSDVPFVKIPDMHGSMFLRHTSEMLSKVGASSQANKTVPAGSLCVSCIGTIGLVSITTVPCQTNQQINSLVPQRPVWVEYLYFSLGDLRPHLINLGSNGATIGNVNKKKFEGMRIKAPPVELVSSYHEIANPILSLVRVISDSSHRLAASRDLLLPRLISGQLSVASAERELEAVA